jgi:hypothetical protein
VAGRADARGRILAPTRAGVWVLFVLALANGAWLYLLPGSADTDYAWPIKPPVNAAFLGAGFLAGTLATGLVLFAATRWRSFETLPPALWVLATTLLAATRATEAVIPYATLAAWCVLLLALPLLHPDDVARGGGDFFAWVAVMVALLGLSALALARSVPRLRATPSPLPRPGAGRA